MSLFYTKEQKWLTALGEKTRKKSFQTVMFDVLTLKPLLQSSNTRSSSEMTKPHIALIARSAKSTQTDYPSITPT